MTGHFFDAPFQHWTEERTPQATSRTACINLPPYRPDRARRPPPRHSDDHHHQTKEHTKKQTYGNRPTVDLISIVICHPHQRATFLSLTHTHSTGAIHQDFPAYILAPTPFLTRHPSKQASKQTNKQTPHPPCPATLVSQDNSNNNNATAQANT